MGDLQDVEDASLATPSGRQSQRLDQSPACAEPCAAVSRCATFRRSPGLVGHRLVASRGGNRLLTSAWIASKSCTVVLNDARRREAHRVPRLSRWALTRSIASRPTLRTIHGLAVSTHPHRGYCDAAGRLIPGLMKNILNCRLINGLRRTVFVVYLTRVSR